MNEINSPIEYCASILNEKCPQRRTCAYGAVPMQESLKQCERCNLVGTEYLYLGAYLYAKKLFAADVPNELIIKEAKSYRYADKKFTITGEPLEEKLSDETILP